MKNLTNIEIDKVAGGWDFEFDIGIVKFSGTGEELAAGYDWAVDQMSDFFTWWDPMGYYSSGC